MNNIQKRWFLFFAGCVPFRVLLVHISRRYANDPTIMHTLALFAMIPMIGFLVLGICAPDTGLRAFGAPIWWHSLRLIHACTYLCFALLAFYQPHLAYLPLLLDLLIGVVAFLNHHSIEKYKLN